MGAGDGCALRALRAGRAGGTLRSLRAGAACCAYCALEPLESLWALRSRRTSGALRSWRALRFLCTDAGKDIPVRGVGGRLIRVRQDADIAGPGYRYAIQGDVRGGPTPGASPVDTDVPLNALRPLLALCALASCGAL